MAFNANVDETVAVAEANLGETAVPLPAPSLQRAKEALKKRVGHSLRTKTDKNFHQLADDWAKHTANKLTDDSRDIMTCTPKSPLAFTEIHCNSAILRLIPEFQRAMRFKLAIICLIRIVWAFHPPQSKQ